MRTKLLAAALIGSSSYATSAFAQTAPPAAAKTAPPAAAKPAPPAAAQAAPAAKTAAPADAQAAPSTDGQTAPSTDAQTAPPAEIVPPKAPERETTLEPKVAQPGAHGRVTFQSDPIADGCIILVSIGSAGVLELINSTGEIRPQQIAPNFDRSKLLFLDRGAVKSSYSKSAATLSNFGLGLAAVYAMADPILSGAREKSVQTGLVDAIMYAETASLTLAMTAMVKIAVRRPRPFAYAEFDAHKASDPNYSNAATDSSLSFFSGHASMTGAIGATATYLAFARSPGTWRPWLTLILATGVTTFTSYGRVASGKHFPTDVIAGAVAGAGIGIVVPHLHRTEDVQQRRVWVGYSPPPYSVLGQAQGGMLTLTGLL